jgi:hypothetical protein
MRLMHLASGDVKDVESGMVEAVKDFNALFSGFSMEGLQTTIGAVATSVTGIKDALGACDIDAIVGDEVLEDMMFAAANIVPGMSGKW